MATVAFPSGFNLARSSQFRHRPTQAMDVMSDGSMRSRTLTNKQFVSISCQFEYLYGTEKDTLEAFILSNAANTITWTVDGIDYSGRIVGAHQVTMSGPLYTVTFEFYGQIV